MNLHSIYDNPSIVNQLTKFFDNLIAMAAKAAAGQSIRTSDAIA